VLSQQTARVELTWMSAEQVIALEQQPAAPGQLIVPQEEQFDWVPAEQVLGGAEPASVAAVGSSAVHTTSIAVVGAGDNQPRVVTQSVTLAASPHEPAGLQAMGVVQSHETTWAAQQQQLPEVTAEAVAVVAPKTHTAAATSLCAQAAVSPVRALPLMGVVQAAEAEWAPMLLQEAVAEVTPVEAAEVHRRTLALAALVAAADKDAQAVQEAQEVEVVRKTPSPPTVDEPLVVAAGDAACVQCETAATAAEELQQRLSTATIRIGVLRQAAKDAEARAEGAEAAQRQMEAAVAAAHAASADAATAATMREEELRSAAAVAEQQAKAAEERAAAAAEALATRDQRLSELQEALQVAPQREALQALESQLEAEREDRAAAEAQGRQAAERHAAQQAETVQAAHQQQLAALEGVPLV